MEMTILQQILTIAIISITTIFTRAIAFVLFPPDRPTPAFVRYLGKVLPAAALGMLAVYCFKNVDLLTGTHGLPEFLSVSVVVGLHIWKRNMFLSCIGGTAVYMTLLNFCI